MDFEKAMRWKPWVPNVPCGVESCMLEIRTEGGRVFLMYRVELKENPRLWPTFPLSQVPNVPCGVESPKSRVQFLAFVPWFLMYRVELKVL